jgi:YVTN family beta-propeller protein
LNLRRVSDNTVQARHDEWPATRTFNGRIDEARGPVLTSHEPTARPASYSKRLTALSLTALVVLLVACTGSGGSDAAIHVRTVPGMPRVLDPSNLYGAATQNRFSRATIGALPRVYVPNAGSDDVSVIDPTTLKVVGRFPVGYDPEHVVPSYDLKTLWVANTAVQHPQDGSVTPIDPTTGTPGSPIAVHGPYNLYFTPDGRSVIVVVEILRRIEFRDPQTFALQQSLPLDDCAGVNHGDFSIYGSYLLLSCEFQSTLVKVDWRHRRVVRSLRLGGAAIPEDVRVAPDGKTFYVADLGRGGLDLIAGDRLRMVGFVRTGTGAHGLVVSRDGTKLFVSNRGWPQLTSGPRHGKGSVSVVDFATNRVAATWQIPGGGSPDMGNISADGRQLWLSGRYDDVVYVFSTKTGAVRSIPVGQEPHGLCVWPEPGRYSLGHTGNMR